MPFSYIKKKRYFNPNFAPSPIGVGDKLSGVTPLRNSGLNQSGGNLEDKITIKFPDGVSQEFPTAVTVEKIINLKEEGRDKTFIAGKINTHLIDLSTPLKEGGKLDFVRLESEEGLSILRHSTSHIMAQAVQEVFEGAKIAIGPAIENGFYYDFDYIRPFTIEDLEKIEKRMEEIIDQDIPFIREEMDRETALKFFQDRKEVYKVELIQDLPDEKVSLYRQGNFIDLCRGPHLPSTGWVKSFKLTGVAGAYWRGDERNPMLQRIYGTSFPSQEELQNHLQRLEEAKKRDHRKLGKELDLFSIQEEVGAGLVIFHPNGALFRTILEDFEKREHLKRGYQIVKGPQILKLDLWKKSGHWDNYRENMYFTEVDNQKYGLKPMNCLAHMMIYKSKIRSYRDLPIRYFELGTVHRHEKTGVLHGLMRVREFTQDDAHIICTPEQLKDEIKGVIDFVRDVMEVFGFPYEMELSTRPKKSIGSDEDWEKATQALMDVLLENKVTFSIDKGAGAFYGPKIDVKLKDNLGRAWQCSTIQCDFTLPERFNLTYIGVDGERHRPAMIHRVILGAIERFMGVLIEHYGGAFPCWLAPVQMVILPITERHHPYGEEVYQRIRSRNFRVEKDFRNEKLGFRIREAQLKKIPYMLVIGDREVETQGISPRTREGDDLKCMELEAFLMRVKSECKVLGEEVVGHSY
ncbi:MAG: threonine--tRNA ligase [Deltaproteobacteria bacterium]|nr:threonine--tRNA ligase [Deltaproteobacteria bacterium]